MAENFLEVMRDMSLEIGYRSTIFQIVLNKHIYTSQSKFKILRAFRKLKNIPGGNDRLSTKEYQL